MHSLVAAVIIGLFMVSIFSRCSKARLSALPCFVFQLHALDSTRQLFLLAKFFLDHQPAWWPQLAAHSAFSPSNSPLFEPLQNWHQQVTDARWQHGARCRCGLCSQVYLPGVQLLLALLLVLLLADRCICQVCNSLLSAFDLSPNCFATPSHPLGLLVEHTAQTKQLEP